ncbi:hypothetical protein ACFSUS_06010 [Spirosoma soli]|uniref:DUF4468 domain-containing protein n=1 Tax=Spirosoma soli TaxID=1770529 RepID=A0ABW5LZF7_9BACT
MKTIFFFLLLSTTALAQFTLPTNEAGQVQYQEIVRLSNPALPARQVYTQIRSWADQHYTASNEAEQQRDDVHGIVFVRSFYPIEKRNVRYTLTVEAKIGRYRATITDLVVEGDGLTLPVRATSSTVEEIKKAADSDVKNEQLVEKIAAEQAELYQQIDRACRATLASLKETLTTTPNK